MIPEGDGRIIGYYGYPRRSLLAGARAVQVGTGTFVDPRCASRVLSGIEAWMEARGVARIEDIAGMLKS